MENIFGVSIRFFGQKQLSDMQEIWIRRSLKHAFGEEKLKSLELQ